MSQLTVTVLQLGLLVLLWIFVISVVGVLRRDLFGTRVVARGTAPAAGRGLRREARRSAAPAPVPVQQTPTAPPPPAPAPPAPTGPPPARLLAVTEGPLAGTTIPLARSTVTIGRAPDCTLVLSDDYASSRHARLVPEGGRWVLEDLGSTNGTTVSVSGRGQGVAVEGSVVVTVGSVVRIGRTALELQR